MVTAWTQSRSSHSLESGASLSMDFIQDQLCWPSSRTCHRMQFLKALLTQIVAEPESSYLSVSHRQSVKPEMEITTKTPSSAHQTTSSEWSLATGREGKRSCQLKNPSFQNIIQIHAKNPSSKCSLTFWSLFSDSPPPVFSGGEKQTWHLLTSANYFSS